MACAADSGEGDGGGRGEGDGGWRVLLIVVKVMVVVVNDEVLSMSLFGYGEVHVCLDRKVYVYLERCMFLLTRGGACLFC